MLGIPTDTRILNTQEGRTQALSIRTFYHTFIIDEDRVHDKASIFKGKQGMGNNVGTSALTALLYLGTGNNYLPKSDYIDPKIKKAKEEGALKIVNRGMGFLEKQKASFEDTPPEPQADELHEKIKQTIDEIGAAKGVLKETLDLCSKLGEKINKLMQQIKEDEVLMDRNQLLLSQYKADIKRLTFIAEGNIASQKIRTVDRCPFCNGKLPHEHEADCIGSAIAEEQKLNCKLRIYSQSRNLYRKSILLCRSRKRYSLSKETSKRKKYEESLSPKLNN